MRKQPPATQSSRGGGKQSAKSNWGRKYQIEEEKSNKAAGKNLRAENLLQKKKKITANDEPSSSANASSSSETTSASVEVDKTGSPRVTLRLNQLKNRGASNSCSSTSEDKKEKGNGKFSSTAPSAVADGDPNETSCDEARSKNVTMAGNMEELQTQKDLNANVSSSAGNMKNDDKQTSDDPKLEISSSISSHLQEEVSDKQHHPPCSPKTNAQHPSDSSQINLNSNNGSNSGNSNAMNNQQSCNTSGGIIGGVQNNPSVSSANVINQISGNNSSIGGNHFLISNNNNYNTNISSTNSNYGNQSGNTSGIVSSNSSSVLCGTKRHGSTDDDEENKKKRRKDQDSSSSSSSVAAKNTPSLSSNLMTSPKSGGGDSESEDNKSVESPGPKVPPLKIVIPSLESNEQGNRNGKNMARHHQALPYIVPRSEPNDLATSSPAMGISNSPPVCSMTSGNNNSQEQDNNGSNLTEEQKFHQRVLRSAHRTGGSSGAPSRSSSPVNADNPSPQQASSPPSEPSVSEPPVEEKAQSEQPEAPPVDLHPRKRKLKQPRETITSSESTEGATTSTATNEQNMTNCYQMFLDVRKMIDKRRKGLFPVTPKPPNGFKDYLMNRCTYILASNVGSRIPRMTPPASLPPGMQELFIEQEKERYRLRSQHIVEKEKLVLCVEQEIVRVHCRAARALANQALPYSVCTILRDKDTYIETMPEQEEREVSKTARSRYNGRRFMSWLRDLDDKWEQIKETMLLRHHNEADSLYAVQKMDWEWKLKELGICDHKSNPIIEESHLPMVQVSDEFCRIPDN